MVVFSRRLPRFEIASPQSLEEALSLLAASRGQARLLAGGTDLLPKLKGREIEIPSLLIDLGRVAGLRYVQEKAGGLRIGALTSLKHIENEPLIRAKFPILSGAAHSIGSVQVRNRGTVAGNICNAVPSADLAPALLVLEARLVLTSKSGPRILKIEDFFLAPGKTALAADEILTEIQLAAPPVGARASYFKHSPRSAMDLAVVGVAVLASASGGICQEVRIGLGAVAPTPLRARAAEALLRGKRANQQLFEQAGAEAAREARPIDDHRASADYRREMVRVLVQRGLQIALTS